MKEVVFTYELKKKKTKKKPLCNFCAAPLHQLFCKPSLVMQPHLHPEIVKRGTLGN